MNDRNKDRIECAIRHIQSSLDVDPWACEIAVEAMKKQLEIVRCKDCKHSEEWYRDKRRCFLWAEDGTGVFEDGFCNYADRNKE